MNKNMVPCHFCNSPVDADTYDGGHCSKECEDKIFNVLRDDEMANLTPDKRWVLVDFDSCPECGDDAEILTASNKSNCFYDGDEVRCCECHHPGQFSCDSETPGYINWAESE